MKRKILGLTVLLVCIFSIGTISVYATENAMFPMEYLNISQGVNDGYSHSGRLAIDIYGRDTGQDAFYAPFTGTIKKTYGTDHVVWLESNEPVQFADGTVDYMTIMCMHDNDISDLYVGKVISQGEHFLTEGTAGNATGNHIHIECGRGQFTGSGWYQNSYGKWCINNGVMPYDALFLSSSTQVINGYGYNWRYLNVNPPSNITISANKTTIAVGETVDFTYNIDNATSKYVGIDWAGGSRYYSIPVDSSSGTVSYTFNEKGTYCVITEGSNSAGYNCCNGIYITVTEKPLWSSYAIASTYKNGHLYSLFDLEYDWDTAKTQAENKGGYLATITSEEENNIITNLISEGSKNQYWIGYTDKDNEGVWKWITGEESDYSNWGNGEPNNTGENGSENYGTYAKSTKKWNDTVNNISSVGVIYEAENFTPTASIYNNNIKYELFDYGMSWTEAKQFCEDRHGHLATIGSSTEDSAIAELVKQGQWEDYWIGCTDEGYEGTWEWITDEEFDYTNWNSSEPNNSGGIEHYGSYVKSSLKWNDAPNVRTKYGIIVEYDDEAWNGYLPNSTIIYNDSVLAVYNRPFSWTEAQEFCQSASGNLVTIEDAEKQNAVVNLVRNAGSHFYIGYTDKDSEGNWKWISGKNSTYTNWNSGEPNNSDGNEDYCELNALQDGKWNDIGGGISSSIYRGFVLEINNLDYAAEMQFNGNTYYRFDNPMPWTEARAYCEMLGGHLVSIATEEENTAMKDFISDGAKSNYWIGYTDYRDEGNFYWIDKTKSTYSNWGTNEPNNCFGCENYATLKKSGLWNDMRSSEFTSCGFICEIEGDEPETTPTPTPEPDEPIPPVTDGAIVKVSSGAASAGNTVDIIVDLSGNEGFANLGIQIGYDSDALTLISASNNSDVGATYTSAQNISANPFNMGWDSTSNVTYNGNLATLTFKVNDNATDGTYPITVSYYKGISGNYTDGEDVNYDADFNSLYLNYVNGIITVSSHVAGDINGDGKVNNQDGTFLLRHLAGWNVNVDESALDINGDGKVNNQDGTVLLRYLAGWSVTIH